MTENLRDVKWKMSMINLGANMRYIYMYVCIHNFRLLRHQDLYKISPYATLLISD